MMTTDTRTTSIFSRARIPVLMVTAATLLWVVVAPRRAAAEAPPGGVTAAEAPSGGVTIVDPDQKFFGRTYSDLVGDWWNWAFQGPAETLPVLDETGEFCGLGQQGKFWFLAGNFGGVTERECTIPGGKALFFPLVNILFWTPDDATTLEEARAGSNSQIDPTDSLSLEIDGVPVSDLFAYRAQTFPGGFVFNIPEGSFLTQVAGCNDGEEFFPCSPGPRPSSVSDGYWIGLRPLPNGPHTIHFTAVVAGGFPDGFELDVTYNLIVGGGGGGGG